MTLIHFHFPLLILDKSAGGTTGWLDSPTVRGPRTDVEHRRYRLSYLVPYQQGSGNVASS